MNVFECVCGCVFYWHLFIVFMLVFFVMNKLYRRIALFNFVVLFTMTIKTFWELPQHQSAAVSLAARITRQKTRPQNIPQGDHKRYSLVGNLLAWRLNQIKAEVCFWARPLPWRGCSSLMQHRLNNWQCMKVFFLYRLADLVRADRKDTIIRPVFCLLLFFLLLPQKCSFFSVLQSCGSTRQPARRCNFSSGRSQRRVERSLRCSTHAGAAAAIVYMPAVTSCLGPNWSLMVVLPISPPIWLQLAGNCLHWSFYNWIFINAWNMRILCIILSKLIIIDLKWWQLNAGEPQSLI